MANNNQFIGQSVSNFVNPKISSIVEPMVLLNEQKFSTKIRRFSTNKIFAIFLFLLLIILISYILFHGKVTDTKLSHLTNNVDFNSNNIRQLLEEINHTLKSIELLLITKTKNSNINILLNGKDIHEFDINQTMLHDFLRKIKERL